jgi:glycosyltransferase involved in cell wall biosynthesis
MTNLIEQDRIAARRTPPRCPPLHVAMVDEELPYPPTSGKRIRTLNLTLRLARRHRLTYLCHRNADAEEAEAGKGFFAEHGIDTVVVERTIPPKSGLSFYARLAMNLLSPLPYTVASHDSPTLRQALRQHTATRPVDLWHCEWTPYAHALRAVSGKRVVVAHNVESVIWQRYVETESNPLRRWYIGRQWRKFRRFERDALREADRTIAVSDVDAARFGEDFGVERLSVVENGVDTHFFQPAAARRDPARLLFLGSLDWRPNLDGVQQLLDEVFPHVRQAIPRATLAVVGRNPPDALRRRIAATPGVELHASVPDVRPHLADCGLMVVPLRIAGGSRLKILEALAAGVPVVSTRVGAEGLHLEAGRDLRLAEGVSDLAPALIEAIRDYPRVTAEAEHGREQVLVRYDWARLADQLERVWLECVNETRDQPCASHI